ncbi:hypothetical protein, partial [Bradyrhizobium tropiciagri]|uniref:hypothetical protein n=1 Tax=Bradyrhizobium tropiciagri TaxID=312253 RepID=UPI001AEC4C19
VGPLCEGDSNHGAFCCWDKDEQQVRRRRVGHPPPATVHGVVFEIFGESRTGALVVKLATVRGRLSYPP